jgi:glutamyl-tRNA synthetase
MVVKMEGSIPARVRFAPSPTGHMHLGSARTALYDFLLAKQTNGKFVVRIEDTDRKRFVEGAEQELLDGLKWTGLEWDEGPDKGGPYGPYRQSERKEIYLNHARDLIKKGKAFYCFCTPQELREKRQKQLAAKENPHYDGTCRNIPLHEAEKRISEGENHVIRFKAPDTGVTTVNDLIRGPITVDNRLIDDHILVKTDGWALYHLAAMVDDHEMRITHVIRGDEWLPTFPLHALIVRAFEWDEPVWVHLSVFLKPSGKGKISKRDTADLLKDGYSIFVKDLEELGYLPEAVINWIVLMGWSLDGSTEFFSLEDLVEKFSLKNLNPSPAAINYTKLDYFNGLHIRNLSAEDLAKRIKPFFEKSGFTTKKAILEKVAPIIQKRIVTLDEAVEMAGFFFKDNIEPITEDMIAKDLSQAQSREVLKDVLTIIELSHNLETEETETRMREYVERSGYTPGQVFGIMRAAVTGQKVSPPLFESMEIIGKQKVIERLTRAIEILKEE